MKPRADHPPYALGGRGQRPIFFPCDGVSKQLVLAIPGVAPTRSGVLCTYDAAPYVARDLNLNPPTRPDILSLEGMRRDLLAMPGLQAWKALDAKGFFRPYQKVGSLFLAMRAYAMCCDPMRSGKTRTALGALTLRAFTKTLIICPALAKYVWAEEIARVLGQEALLLEGRGAVKARVFCMTCMGRGRLEGQHCPNCKARNGQSLGTRIVTDIEQALQACSIAVVNYDLLTKQQRKTATGKVEEVAHLPGWAEFLAEVGFQCFIGDELHNIRGFSTATKRKGHSRRERFNLATDDIPVGWGLTGTPIFGFTRDLWGQLDSLSKGAMASAYRRTPFPFHAYFCEGGPNGYGGTWKADGRSVLAETELPERLKVVMIKRPRSEILKDMPAKVRQVYRVDALPKPKEEAAPPVATTEAELEELDFTGLDSIDTSQGPAQKKPGRLIKLLAETLAAKIDMLCENVIADMTGEGKAIVFVYTRNNAMLVDVALGEAIQKKDVSQRMQEVNAMIWRVTGDVSQESRFKMAAAFREHQGGGCFIATCDSMQVAISLKSMHEAWPTTTVHFADLHWNPAALLQAEDRPYEPGVKGLTVAYYVCKDSFDEHVEEIVLPKVATLAELMNEEGAQSLSGALTGWKPQETLDDLYARLLSNTPEGEWGEDDPDD